MMEQGLLDEVRALKERGLSRDSVAMQGLGYRNCLAFWKETVPSMRRSASSREIHGILQTAAHLVLNGSGM